MYVQVCVYGAMKKTETSCHGQWSLTQHHRPVQPPVCVPKDDTDLMDSAEPSSPNPKQTFTKGSVSVYKRVWVSSELKKHISAVNLALRWTRTSEDPFQTELVECS